MRLDYLLKDIKDEIVKANIERAASIDIKGLSLNSKSTKPGDLFFGLSGTKHKGSDFAAMAFNKGAQVIITSDEIKVFPDKKAVIKVKDVIGALASISNKFYNYPQKQLNLTAVTGTNGKTTVTFLLEKILSGFNKGVGVVGTVNYRFGKNVSSALNTTPDILTLQKMFAQLLKKNIHYLVMEVSSHALQQRRIEGIRFDQAIFTNLTQDHFDYHKNKSNYFLAKSKLFLEYLKDKGVAIVNKDDVYGVKLIELIKKKNKSGRVITYGIKKSCDLCASDIRMDLKGSVFMVRGIAKLQVKTNLVGIFNVYNILAGIAGALAMGIPNKHILEGVNNVYVPGRLEKIVSSKGSNIFVDYAHTEDALKNVLLCLRQLKGKGRLIVVFGCGGNRDKDKRHKMGSVASKLADFVVITSDNPRSEEPRVIVRDILKGVKRDNYSVFLDRREAIKEAIKMADSGDIMVVAGKGHENYQIVKDKKINFSDVEVIKELLKH